MDCNLYFSNISGVENRVSFQNNVRYSKVVAKRGSDGRAVQKFTQKVIHEMRCSLFRLRNLTYKTSRLFKIETKHA